MAEEKEKQNKTKNKKKQNKTINQKAPSLGVDKQEGSWGTAMDMKTIHNATAKWINQNIYKYGENWLIHIHISECIMKDLLHFSCVYSYFGIMEVSGDTVSQKKVRIYRKKHRRSIEQKSRKQLPAAKSCDSVWNSIIDITRHAKNNNNK